MERGLKPKSITRSVVREHENMSKPKRGGAGNKPKQKTAAKKDIHRTCKPGITKIAKELLPSFQKEGIPPVLLAPLTEFHNAQPFFSAMERIDPEVTSQRSMTNCWAGIPSDSIQDFSRDSDESFYATLTMKEGSSVPIFIKRIHIMDPIATIEGESINATDGGLPLPSEIWMNTIEKVNDPMNEAYVDAMFAMLADRMVSNKISPHWCRCYGTFPARVDTYMYNISEEYPSMKRKPFWKRNLNLGLFRLHKESDASSEAGREPKVVFSGESDLQGLDFEEINDIPKIERQIDRISISSDIDTIEAEEVGSIQLSEPTVRIQKIINKSREDHEESDHEESDHEDSDHEESDHEDNDYNEYFAEFRNYPVQVTLLERAEGTLDELLEAEENTDVAEIDRRWKAWMFQIIAALNAAQYYYGFVHNDLHTNNVMWSKTDQEYIYYRVNKDSKSWLMRVPTFGYIMKIIDFGRATFWLPEPAGFFISDAFYPGNDASDQYNCEPFYDESIGKKVEPNPSFDLCRLAVSMLESLYVKRPAAASPIKIMSREGSKSYTETVSPLYNLMWEWIQDDEGKNILRLPNGEERYPSFDLYSAIAADVHKAVPSQQIEKPLFAEYNINEIPKDVDVFNLWVR